MTQVVDTTFEKAINVLKGNSTKLGLRTSLAYYNQIWARDSFITFLGANLLEDEELMALAKTTVKTFARTHSPLGQIANFYDPVSGSPEFGFSGSTDSSCWYIIGLASLYHASEDRSLLKEPLRAAVGAYKWLRFQDANNTWLIDSPQGADWMDAAVQRSGKTLYNNTLFLVATRCIERLTSESKESVDKKYLLDWSKLKQRFDDVFLPEASSPRRVAAYWPRMSRVLAEQKPMGFSRKYFLHYASFHRLDTHFDTLSNVFCVLSGLAPDKTVGSIFETIRAKGISRPYPARNLAPPYRIEGVSFDKSFDSVLPVQHKSVPFAYHNGAVWPFVGGVYVCALFQRGIEYASKELENLAKANLVLKKGESVGFNEWLQGETGEALGAYGQSWSAGMYIGACLSAKGKDPMGFLN